MLIVISRVTSAMVLTSRPRCRQASFSVAARSRGLCDPIAGGTVSSRGPRTSARPASHASHFGMASASFLDQCDTDAKRNYESVSHWSKKDADAMPKWDAWLAGLADVLGPLLLTVPPAIGSHKPRDLAATL